MISLKVLFLQAHAACLDIRYILLCYNLTWSISLTVLYMIGLSKINERLPDMTRNEMVPDVSVLSKI